ncbi:hypothetical protein EON80_24550, partial [bacterium]
PDTTDDAYIFVNNGAGNVLANRHFEGTNILFLDGHVKYFNNQRAYSSNVHIGGKAAGSFVDRGDGCPS